MIRIHAPAKVNLALRVLAREASGFHQLETLFSALEFGDILTLDQRGSGISLKMDGLRLGPPQENLVYLAAKGFRELAGIEDGFEIHLEKRIPVQAGLGGGSSDAGAILRGLQALFPGRIREQTLLKLAASIGADVPFFLCGSGFALAWGRGDRILSLPPLPQAPVLLAIPPQGVSTPEAYALLASAHERKPRVRGPAHFSGDSFRSWDEVRAQAENDFEEVIFPTAPALARLQEAFDETGPLFSLMSGSGSALFAVYQGEEEVQEARASMVAAFPGVRFIQTRTLETIPEALRTPGG